MLNSEIGYHRKRGFTHTYIHHWCKISIIFHYVLRGCAIVVQSNCSYGFYLCSQLKVIQNTEKRRETISYKTLITHWNHDWCEYIDDFFIFYFHFKSFNMLIVAVMMKHCSFYKQQAWRLNVCRTCITRRHVSCRWGLSWDFFREIVWYTDCGDGLSWL